MDFESNASANSATPGAQCQDNAEKAQGDCDGIER
jgi:hypothetical protein